MNCCDFPKAWRPERMRPCVDRLKLWAAYSNYFRNCSMKRFVNWALLGVFALALVAGCTKKDEPAPAGGGATGGAATKTEEAKK